MKGTLPGRSVEIMPFNASRQKMLEPTWWFRSMWLLGGDRGGSGSGSGSGAGSGSGSGAGLLVVDRMP